MYVSRYNVDRCYGGPEEGGWWYDEWAFTGIVAIMAPDATPEEGQAIRDALTEAARAEKAEHGEHDRSSVIGTPDIIYVLEESAGEEDNTKADHSYC